MTLDELVVERFKTVFNDKVSDELKIDTWTLENRDEKFSSFMSLIDQGAGEAVQLVKDLTEPDATGKSPFFSRVKLEFLAMQLEEMLNLRATLDTITDEELAGKPLDSNWINTKIRVLYKELNTLQEIVDKEFSVEPKIEEL